MHVDWIGSQSPPYKTGTFDPQLDDLVHTKVVYVGAGLTESVRTLGLDSLSLVGAPRSVYYSSN